MTYATELVNNYRMALRNLWNGHYWIDHRFRDSETVWSFMKVTLPMYQALVHSRLEPLGEPASTVFGNGFSIVAKGNTGQIADLMVESSSGVWSQLSGPFAAPPLRLTLLDFFDWQQSNWRDYRYFIVRIENFEAHPELIGKRALVEVIDVDVFWGPR